MERLGPAYVKVAQAVSTRVDILSPAYLIEIERLQDRVPPFPTSDVRPRQCSFVVSQSLHTVGLLQLMAGTKDA